jgi:Undecaprenyl-phosphate glucose phosphotransferase
LIAAALVVSVIYLPAVYDQVGGMTVELRLYYYLLVFSALIVQANVFHFAGIYRFETLSNLPFQIGRCWMAVAILFLIILALLYLTRLSEIYSRGWMLLWFGLTLGGVTVVRLTACPALRKFIDGGHLARRVAIIGSGTPAERLSSYLQNLQSNPIKVIGLYDDRTAPRDDTSPRRPDGTVNQLCELARREQVDQIILAMPSVTEARLAGILRKMRSLPVDVRLCRDTFEFLLPQSSFELCGVVPLVRLYDRPISGWGHLAKNVEDKLLAGWLLLLLGPALLLIAALIKLDSKGPVFFRQARYGFNNRIIIVWKFRTMHVDRGDHSGAQQVSKNDPRVTRMGGLLRRWSLDELPQLLNVLVGDMSIVGPRPHPIMCGVSGRLFSEVVDEYAARHRVKPGITGWAQVHGWHGAADTEEKIENRVKFDLQYIDHWSIMLDLKILIMTILVVLRRKEA